MTARDAPAERHAAEGHAEPNTPDRNGGGVVVSGPARRCCAPGSSTPPTCGGPSPASRTRSSSATTAPTTSCSSACTRVASRSPGASQTPSPRSRAPRSRSARSTSRSTATTSACARSRRSARPRSPTSAVAGRGAGRRRPVHRAHRARRARSPARAGPAPRRPARGARRPRPPRAADPGRLRRQEPAHEDRRGRARPPRRGRRPATTASRSGGPTREAPALHRRPRDVRLPDGDLPDGNCRRRPARRPTTSAAARGIEAMLDLTDSFVEVTRRDIPKVPALRGKTVVSLFYEDSTRTRLSFETAAKRLSADTMTFSVVDVVGEEGREPARHRADDRGDGRRRDRRTPRAPPAPRTASRAGRDASVVNGGDGRHEHPTQALLDAFTLRRHRGPSLDGCRVAIVGDIAQLARRAEQREGVPRARLRRHARRARRRCFPIGSTAGRSRSRTTSTTCCPMSTSCTCCASSVSASVRRRFPSIREYARRCGLTAERAARLQARHARDASRADEPRRRDRGRGRRLDPLARHRTGRERRRGPHGRVVVAARLRRPDCLTRRSSSSAADVSSTSAASGSPTCASSTVASPRSATGLERRRGAIVLDAEGCDRHAGPRRHPGALPRARPRRRRDDRDAVRGPPRWAGAPRSSACRTPSRRSTTPRWCSRCSSGAGGAVCDVRVAGCITKGRRGEELAPLGELYDLGVRVFTDDGDCVADAQVMRRRVRVRRGAARRGARAARRGPGARARRSHARRRVVGAARHPGPARRGGVVDRRPRPRARPAAPVAATTCCTCRRRSRPRSCARRRPTACGSPPSARRSTSCSPTHVCAGFDPVFKMNPPLREQADVDALRAALADGTIDAIATDHAPHAPETKAVPFEEAPPGHARRRDRARGRAHDARRARRPDAARRPSPRCRGARPASPGLDAATVTAARSRPAGPRTSA